MLSRHCFFLLCLLALLAPADAHAKKKAAPKPKPIAQETLDPARSAIAYAGRGDWKNARQQAAAAKDPVVAKLVAWQYLLDAGSGASFSDITGFITENPNWPDQKKLKLRAEQSLRDGNVKDADIINWFSAQPPISGIGKIALAEAMQRTGGGERIAELVREAWKDGDFEEAQEKDILAAHGALLSADDHISRIDRLLWEEKPGPAKRMFSRVPEHYRKLFDARIALIGNKRNAASAVAQVDSELKNDPGLLFDRMRYRLRKGDDAGVREMLLKAPPGVPYPEKWWRAREMEIRRAIGEGNYHMAMNLLANHGQNDGQEFADALWLQGWLALEFQQRPETAYETFYRLYNNVRFPVSKARAAYWTGRAAEAAGDQGTADNWYASAAAYPTTFYGQLASLKRSGATPLRVPAEPQVGTAAADQFEASELARAARLAIKLGETDMATRIIAYLIESAPSDEQIILASRLGRQAGVNYLSVHAAKRAQQRGVFLIESGYPLIPTPDDLPIERALALAVVRQESEFDAKAKSSANAMGLMQLRAATAKETAKKSGGGFSKIRLYEPQYNVRLGSRYLHRLMNGYDGSAILAIAAYNAGPGNVRGWLRQFGIPAHDLEKAVNWIEKIPFAETRNYVQRVLENLQVYRHLEAAGNPPDLALAEDLSTPRHPSVPPRQARD